MQTDFKRISVTDAKPLVERVAELSDEEVRQGYDAFASHISYLNADDYGGDWKFVPQFRPGLDAFAAEIERRGIERPAGPYLI